MAVMNDAPDKGSAGFVAGAGVLFGLLVVVQLEAVDFVVAGLAGLSLGVALLASVGWLLAGAIRRSSRLAGRGVLLAGVLVVSTMVSGAIADRQIRVSRSRGDLIREAILRYRERAGELPAALSDLVPNELAVLPAPATGVLRSFCYDYRRHEDGSFAVAFACAPFMSWRCDADGQWREFD